jgi:hypothetical protein
MFSESPNGAAGGKAFGSGCRPRGVATSLMLIVLVCVRAFVCSFSGIVFVVGVPEREMRRIDRGADRSGKVRKVPQGRAEKARSTVCV